MPKWTFENKITLGNLIQIAFLIAGAFAAHYGITGAIAKGESDNQDQDKAIAVITATLPSLQQTDVTLNTRLTVVESRAETQALETAKVVSAVDALVDAINADRLAAATNDTAIKKDVGFLRDWVEEQKREAKRP